MNRLTPAGYFMKATNKETNKVPRLFYYSRKTYLLPGVLKVKYENSFKEN